MHQYTGRKCWFVKSEVISQYCKWLRLADHGWGLLSQFPPIRYFPIFSALSNHTLAIEYHVYIWQVSPQLSCGDTCQIWMWFEESNMCFCQVENFAYGEIHERSFSNPHPTSDIQLERLERWLMSKILFHIGYVSMAGLPNKFNKETKLKHQMSKHQVYSNFMNGIWYGIIKTNLLAFLCRQRGKWIV